MDRNYVTVTLCIYYSHTESIYRRVRVLGATTNGYELYGRRVVVVVVASTARCFAGARGRRTSNVGGRLADRLRRTGVGRGGGGAAARRAGLGEQQSAPVEQVRRECSSTAAAAIFTALRTTEHDGRRVRRRRLAGASRASTTAARNESVPKTTANNAQ